VASEKQNANVLVTAAGTVIAQGIIKSLKLASSAKSSPLKYTITATDIAPEAPGLYRSDHGLLVPPAGSKGYVDSIVEACAHSSAEAVFIGADEELKPLAGAAERIRRESGAVVIVGSREFISVGQDKWKTFQFLKKSGLPTAESALPEDADGFIEAHGFPLVVKPREGHGSIGLTVARSRRDVKDAARAIERLGWRPLLQEYLDAEDQEYTSGVTLDRSGRSVLSSISMRRRLKGGQTFKAFIDDFPEVRKAAEAVAMKIRTGSPINVQSRVIRGEAKAFEINPRFSASCPMRAAAGVNEPDLVFRSWVKGEDVKITAYDKLVCLRYLNEVYVPHSVYDRAVATGRMEGGGLLKDYF
jgi:carbamoyl-phosphate synthase large subunit